VLLNPRHTAQRISPAVDGEDLVACLIVPVPAAETVRRLHLLSRYAVCDKSLATLCAPLP
jgi:hypothetical protein